MYEWKATNAIYLDDEVAGKGRQFKCRFLVPGLVKYDFGVCLLTKENADKFIQEFVGCPVIINHQDLTDKNAKEKSVGNIFSVWFDEKDGYYWCNGIITDKHAIELIDKGYSVSCQYTITDYSDNTTGALHNGNSYDKLIEDGKPEHLAIVNNPRYEGAIIAVNAILAQNEEQWITIKPNGEDAKGRHLLIKEGETVHEAMERTYGIDGAKGQQKLFDTSGDRKTKEDFKREAEEKQKKADEHQKQVQKRYDNLEHLGVAEPDKLGDVEGEEMSYEKWESQKQSDTKEEKGEPKKYDEIVEEYKDYFNESQLKEFKKELARFDEYKGLENIDLKDSKETFKKLKPEDALERLKRSNDWVEKNNKEEKLKKRFYDYVEKNDFKDDRVLELARFIGGFENLGINKPMTLKEMQDDNRYNFHTELALKYLADKSGFDNYFKNNEDDRIKAGYDKFIEIVYGKNKASNSFVEQFKDTLYTVLAEGIANRLGELIASNEDKWITIHPHGDDSEDYRRLKLKDGESPKEAMQRMGWYEKRKAKDEKVKEDKESKKEQLNKEKQSFSEETQKIRDLVKADFDKTQYYEQIDKETTELWNKYTKALRETNSYFKDSEEVKKIKNDKLNALYQEYIDKRDERSNVVSELNEIIRETKKQQAEVLNKLKDQIDIKNSLKNYDSKEITQKIEKVISEFNMDKLNKEYKEITEKIDAEKDKWLKYLNSASSVEEQNKRALEYDDWYKNSELKDKKDKVFDKVVHFDEYRHKAISEALQMPNGGDFNITTIKNSKLKNKVKRANELLSGIVNKDYLPNFSPFANGKTGRANATGNIINITSKHDITTYIHESMHWLERVNPNMLANSMAFLEYRTNGETPKNLKKLTGLNYKPHEEAKIDNFFNPYCGKVYDRATEIMSMGIQRLFEAPEEFIKEDKEYFDFVIANLQGKI